MKNTNVPIIAGSGRSGTTWVLDALALPNKRRTIFEPLHPACVANASKYSYRYIGQHAKNDVLNHFFRELLEGAMHGIWIDYRVRSDRVWPTLARFSSLRNFREWYLRLKKLVRNRRRYRPYLHNPPMIKMIRGNLLLGWLVKNFSVNVALLVRHPGAVIESMNRLRGEDWEPEKVLSIYQEQIELLERISPKARKLIALSKTELEKYMLAWCLENALPIREAEDNGVHVVFYENLVVNPEKEWCSLASALGLDKVPDESVFITPSQQAAPGKKSEDYAKVRLGRWMEAYSTSELKLMQDILDQLDVTCYRMDDPLPVLRCKEAIV